MKRYLVYYDKTPLNGIDAIDYIDARRKVMLLTPQKNKKHIRIRLARTGLLKALASQGEYR